MSTINGGWRGPNIVKDGLVLYLDAGSPNSYYDKSSTTWKDISGGGKITTLINGPIYNTSSGGSIVFDGSNDYVNLTVATSGDTTYAIWFKISVNNDNRRLFDAATPNFRNFSIGYAGSGANNVLGGYDGTNQPLTTASFGDGLWHYAAVVMKTNDYKIYVDGQNQTLTWNLGTTGNWINNSVNVNYIGSTGASSFFQGNIAQTQIYNRALSASEVLQNFNATRARFGV